MRDEKIKSERSICRRGTKKLFLSIFIDRVGMLMKEARRCEKGKVPNTRKKCSYLLSMKKNLLFCKMKNNRPINSGRFFFDNTNLSSTEIQIKRLLIFSIYRTKHPVVAACGWIAQRHEDGRFPAAPSADEWRR